MRSSSVSTTTRYVGQQEAVLLQFCVQLETRWKTHWSVLDPGRLKCPTGYVAAVQCAIQPMNPKYMDMFSCLLAQWREPRDRWADPIRVELVITSFEGFLTEKTNLCAFFDHFGGIDWELTVYISQRDRYFSTNLVELRAHWESPMAQPPPSDTTVRLAAFLHQASEKRRRLSNAAKDLKWVIPGNSRNRIGKRHKVCLTPLCRVEGSPLADIKMT